MAFWSRVFGKKVPSSAIPAIFLFATELFSCCNFLLQVRVREQKSVKSAQNCCSCWCRKGQKYTEDSLSFFAFCFHREAFLSLCSLENFVQNLTGMGQIFRLFPQAKHIHLPCFGAILTVNGLFFLCGVFCFDSHEPGLV